MLNLDQIPFIILAGAIGALASELLKDNCVEMPKKIGAKFSLGIIGSMIVGAIAGYYVDGSPETAFMAGFMGPQLLAAILKKKQDKFLDGVDNEVAEITATTEEQPQFEDIEAMIRWKAARAGVEPDLAVAVAKCESGLKPNAINVNSGGSKDRGIYQWNDKYHPEITDKMAFDPETATDLFLKAVNAGHLSWWSASAKCWNASGKYKI